MHAFGLNRDLCCEFLKKQCHILNLTKGEYNNNNNNKSVTSKYFPIKKYLEQEKLLYDNVTRLYRETDPWREQVHQKPTTSK